LSQEIQIRIFSLSTEAGFEKGNLGYAIYWLMKKGNNPYLFLEKTPKDFPIGSIVLFDFEGQIFGQAITSEEVKKLSPEEQKKNGGFKASVRFEQSSIDVFFKYLPISEVEKILGRECARNFTIVNWRQYQEVLKAVGRIPE
jgi:hypothetical protein